MTVSNAFSPWIKALVSIRKSWKSLLTLTALSLLLGLLSQGGLGSLAPGIHEGDISRQNVKAPVDLKVIDDQLTEKRKDAVAAAIKEVYDYDPVVYATLSSHINEVGSWIEESKKRRAPDLRSRSEQLLQIQFSDEEWSFVIRSGIFLKLAAQLRADTGSLQRPWVFREIPADGISLRDVSSGQEIVVSKQTLDSNSKSIASLKTEVTRSLVDGLPQKQKKDIAQKNLQSLLSKLLIENLSLNSVETKERKDEALLKVDPIMVEVKKGEMIIREGQRADRRHVKLIESFRQADTGSFDFKAMMLFAALIFVVTWVLYSVGRKNFKKFKLSFRDQIVMGSFLFLSTALLTGLFALFQSAQDSYLIAGLFVFLIPYGFVGMTLRLFSSMEITTFIILLQSLAIAWIVSDPFVGILTLCSALAGAAQMRRISQRLDVFKAGLQAGIVLTLLIWIGMGLDIVSTPPLESVSLKWILITVFAMLSGLLSSGFVLAVQPVLESLGYTTDLRLMELSRTDHPLLKDLILKAPGTYFHSFTVSQLAEKAAEAVHGNSLFARVAALYHDIGKTGKPSYFIENQKGENKHDKLAPTMSALIISNHVKDGIELAMAHKLPPAIIDIIPQHHGTSLISFFYDKALQQAEIEADVNEQDFRYPGPKPQTKEAAIILMADAVEATAKSMSNATEDQLKQMVNKTIQRFFLDGQLEECELSLKDLASISSAFSQVLQGVYHHRIDYPHLKEKTNTSSTSVLHLKNNG